MLNFEYQPEEYTGPTVDDHAADLQGDAAAATWDADQDRDREVAYYERLAFSNPQDATTIEAQRWLSDYERGTVQAQPATSHAKSTMLGNLITAKQLSMIRATANDFNIDVAGECGKLFGIRILELSKKGAAELIEHLQQVKRNRLPAAKAA